MSAENTEKDLNALGELIKKYRTESSMYSAELAKKAGVAQSYISDLENGKKKKPRLDVLENIVSILGKSLSKDERTAFYLNVLTLAGLREERNRSAHGVKKEKNVPLWDFVKQLEEQENRPLENKEFLLTYKEDENTTETVRSTAGSFNALFDLTNIGNTYKSVTYQNGISAYGKTSTYYNGRELTKNEIKQVKNLIDAILNTEEN